MKSALFTAASIAVGLFLGLGGVAAAGWVVYSRSNASHLSGTAIGVDGKPLAGVTVNVYGTDKSGTTAATGVASVDVSGLPAGSYAVSASKAGYTTTGLATVSLGSGTAQQTFKMSYAPPDGTFASHPNQWSWYFVTFKNGSVTEANSRSYGCSLADPGKVQLAEQKLVAVPGGTAGAPIQLQTQYGILSTTVKVTGPGHLDVAWKPSGQVPGPESVKDPQSLGCPPPSAASA